MTAARSVLIAVLFVPAALATNILRVDIGDAYSFYTTDEIEIGLECRLDETQPDVEVTLGQPPFSDIDWDRWEHSIRVSYGLLGQELGEELIPPSPSYGHDLLLSDAEAFFQAVGWAETMTLQVVVDVLDEDESSVSKTEELFVVGPATWCNLAKLCGQQQHGCAPASIKDTLVDDMEAVIDKYKSSAEVVVD